MRWQPGMNLSGLLNACNEMLAEPLPFEWSNQTPRFLLIFTGLYAVIVLAASSEHRNTRPGEEHGSARWGNAKELNRRYRDTQGPNLLMTRNIRIGVDGYKHKHNTNVLVVGGSGAGKTRTYAVPNVLEAGCSMVITDPKGEILRKTGGFLKRAGYDYVYDMDGKKICEAVSAELLAFGPHCSQAALEKHLRDQKRNEREVREYLEERVRPYELRLEDGARPSDAVGMIDLTIKATPSQKLVSMPKDRMFRSEQASKTSRKKATDDTFLNAKGDKALSLLRAMNE